MHGRALGAGKGTQRAAEALGPLSGGDVAAEGAGWASALCPEARASWAEGPAAGGCRGTHPRPHGTCSCSGMMGCWHVLHERGEALCRKSPCEELCWLMQTRQSPQGPGDVWLMSGSSAHGSLSSGETLVVVWGQNIWGLRRPSPQEVWKSGEEVHFLGVRRRVSAEEDASTTCRLGQGGWG